LFGLGECSTTTAFSLLAGRMGSSDRASKQQAFLTLLQEGWTSLHLDARREGVIVPAHLKGEAHLVLQYGNDLPIPITDLIVDEEGVRATLSFSRTPQPTRVPWSAVYVIANEDGRGVLYNEDIPRDVAVVASKTETVTETVLDAVSPPSADPGQADPELATAATNTLPTTADGLDDLLLPARPASATPTRRTLRSIPLESALESDAAAPPPLADLSVGSPAAESSLPDTVPGVRRRRKPQLRLVK
jgi:stringent starvation protein B